MDERYQLRRNPRPSLRLRESRENQNISDNETDQIGETSSHINFVNPTPETSDINKTNENTDTDDDDANINRSDTEMTATVAAAMTHEASRDIILPTTATTSHSPSAEEIPINTPPPANPVPVNTPTDVAMQTTAPEHQSALTEHAQSSDLIQQLFALVQDMRSEIKGEISEIKNNISNQNDALKGEIINEIKNDISNQNDTLRNDILNQNDVLKNEIKTDILNCQHLLESQISQIQANQNSMKAEIEQLTVNQAQQAHEITKFKEEVAKEIDSRESQIREHLIIDLKSHTTDIENLIQKTNSLTLHKMENQNSEIQGQIKTIIPIINSNSEQIRYQNNTISEMNQRLLEQSNTIENLQKNPVPSQIQYPAQINVVCSGNSGLVCEMNLPKFNGRGHNPKEFISKLHKYYKYSLNRKDPKVDPIEHLTDIIESSLEHHASRWFNLIKSDIDSWETFERIFEEKYWSRDTQRGIKQKLETERYRIYGNLTRSEYFIERVLTLQSLTPKMSEEEIVILLSEHFDDLTQDARRVQNITTIHDFEALLLREDIKDTNRKSKPRTNPVGHESEKDSHKWRNQHRDYPPRNQDHRAYQPPQRNYQHPYQRPDYNKGNNNRPPYNQYRNPQYQTNPRNQNDTRRYPTNEQEQVCATIKVKQTPPNSPPKKTKDLN